MTTIRRHICAAPPSFHNSYKVFTHGGNYWQDLYLLDRWDRQLQPVVYRNEVYRGYELLRRIPVPSMLPRHRPPQSQIRSKQNAKRDCSDFLTIKFLSRDDSNELQMSKHIQEHCKSRFVSTTRDHFTIPHHLSQTSPRRFGNIRFQAIVYPLRGICMGRIHDPGEYHDDNPDIPLTLERRLRYIGQVIRGVSDLHSIGVVHAGRFLANPPLEHDVRLKDGSLPPQWMPQRVSEPEDIGFSPTGIKIIDFGYSFRPIKGACYTSYQFPKGGQPPPELLCGKKQTALPFKADSWGLGHLIYFVLTGSVRFRRSLACNDEGLLAEYRLALDELRAGHDYLINGLPKDVQSRYVPVILGLLELDPGKRLAVEELIQEPYAEIANVVRTQETSIQGLALGNHVL
ncbi:hypothetical protein LLEC1_02634 [Akanthomyces lecanii]|uniref:Protein kinase domain-containing protein n=1 Tax=Cordyceps confragosa TaxID=2714763 RepID=A0A179IHT6_CORDF|nr:hypothetical protein LLEC1_02634 [Akanthomyces lecanii]